MNRSRVVQLAAALALIWFVVGALVVPGLGKRVLVDNQVQGCLPWSVYWNTQARPAQWRDGDLVVFDTPKMRAIDPQDRARKLKMVAALPGQTVSVRQGRLWVNGQYWGKFWLSPWVARKAPDTKAPWFQYGQAVDGTWTIPAGKVLLLGTEPLSFDGRYWGLIDLSQLGPQAIAL